MKVNKRETVIRRVMLPVMFFLFAAGTFLSVRTTMQSLHEIYMEHEEHLLQLTSTVDHNIGTYGFPGWYEWANNHWGTKWNACEVTVERYSDLGCNIRFDTAWCAPMPIFYALEKQFPEMELTAWWVDEEDWELQENDPEFMSGSWCSERRG